jgi:hypothetical protein
MKELTLIQNELKVPKGNLNKFGNYKYRSAEDILEAVKPVLLKHNAMVYLSDEIISIGTKIFLKSTACLTIGEKQICVNGFAETSEHKGMSAEQTTGTASSYARKYALNGLFLIDETEQDADSKYGDDKKETPLTASQKIENCTNLDDLGTVWNSLSKDEQKQFVALKDAKKLQLSKK